MFHRDAPTVAAQPLAGPTGSTRPGVGHRDKRDDAQRPTMSSGRTGTLLSSRPVAARNAATTAAVETTVGGSPTPLTPYGASGSSSSISSASTGGMSSVVGIR